MNINFTLNEYDLFLSNITDKNIYTVQKYLKIQPQDNFLILRHDVDRSIINSYMMAKLEAKNGIRSSYYFRVPNTFDVKIISKIEDMGHEIGYHYETLSRYNGDYDKAIKQFQENLKLFRQNFDVKTISMHGKPLSKHNNIDLWTKFDYRDFDIIGDAILTISDTEIYYITDTGRTWNNTFNLRDMGNYKQINKKHNNLVELFEYIKLNKINKIYLNTHPERWGYNRNNWLKGYFRDLLFNTGKQLITIYQR